MSFDAKTDTPVAATAVASADKFVFGDVSADGWDTILAENVLDALIRLSAGSYYAYASSQHTIKDGAGGLAEFISDKLIARQDGGVAGTDEVQIYHDGTHGYVFPKSGDLYLGGHDSLFIGVANAEIQFLNNADLKHQTNNWYLSSLGYFRCQVQVEANTAGSGSPNILTSSESRSVMTNEGTGAQNYHTLPTAAAGLDYEFVVQNAYGIRIVANTGDTIRDGDSVSAAAGYLASTKIGSVVRVKAINATEWVVVYKSGHWVVDGVGSATATQITGDQNNYAPATASFLRISSDAARNITGLVAGMDGEQRVFLNVGSYAITLKHESASSTTANRFTCATAADIAVDAGSIVALVYDGTSARWRAR